MKNCALILTFLVCGHSLLYGEPRTAGMDKQVAALIGKMVNKATEHKAFADLEALGCPAVPSIIRQMEDPNISLENKWPDAFEANRFYGPKRVVDALAAILNQITGAKILVSSTMVQPTPNEQRQSVDGKTFCITHQPKNSARVSSALSQTRIHRIQFSDEPELP